MPEKKLSDTYERAKVEGKKVLYVCAMGRSRSPISAMYANRRGEVGSSSLSGGYQSLYQDKNNPDIDSKIASLVSGNVLRIFGTDEPSFLWFQDKLKSLEATGKIPKQSFEALSITTVMKEMRSGGQDAADLARAMLDD